MYRKIKYLIDHKACLGCGLCVVKGEMVLSKDGFYHPSKDCIIDPKIKSYCPGYKIIQKKKKRRKEEILYGPFIPPVLVGHIKDENINYKASSGGIITGLLICLLKNKDVDSILQVCSSHKNPLLSKVVVSRTEEDVINCIGSRYAPCSLFENFESSLKDAGRVAVVGKPCDIAALKAYMDIYPTKTISIKYTLSMMCMGLPSQNATSELVSFLGEEEKNITSLRYRGHGWPGYATIRNQKGEIKQCTYIQSWGAILGRDTLFRCKVCPNGFGEFADITCGDGWFLKDGNEEPSFENKDKGRSLIFIRSEKGKNLVEKAFSQGLIETQEYNLDEIPLIQKSQYERKINFLGRFLIYKFLINPKYQVKGFNLFRLSKIAGMHSILFDSRGFLGRWWRGYKGYAKNRI